MGGHVPCLKDAIVRRTTLVGDKSPVSELTTAAQPPIPHTFETPLRRMSGSVAKRPFSCGAFSPAITGAAELPIVHTIVAPLSNVPSSSDTPSGVAEVTRAF